MSLVGDRAGPDIFSEHGLYYLPLCKDSTNKIPHMLFTFFLEVLAELLFHFIGNQAFCLQPPARILNYSCEGVS